jgi:cytochrome c peroxidase
MDTENRNKRVTFTRDKKHNCSAVHNILNLEKKYHPVGAISKSNTKIIVTEATSMPLIITQITNRSLSCLGTSTLIKKQK